jgi:tetratricopeptide (TPR) repeat protein
MAFASANAEIYVKGPKGEPVDRPAVVTLFRTGGQLFVQGTTKAGFVKFERVPYSEFTAQVVAPGYQTTTKKFEINGPGAVTVTFDLQPLEAEEAAAAVGFYALSPKVQKDVGKALEALRANKPTGALNHLQAAQRNAPNSAEIEYLFGVYSDQVNDHAQAKSHWMKTLEINPRHLSALLAIGQDFLHDNKPAEAAPYLTRATEVDPTSWRAQALLAEASVLQGKADDAVEHAQRAIELGHDRAAKAQLVIARVHVERHEIDQAVSLLEAYVKTQPADKDTAQYLEKLKNPPANTAGNGGATAGDLNVVAAAPDALPVPSNWLPPDVDASVPAVEPGATCAVDDVVQKAGKQLKVLVADVDRFTATEFLLHESINRYGMASPPENRKFNYVVSIQEIQHGYLNVEEYRSSGNSPAEFPDGVATNGLPALVLIFHPYNAINFEMKCEGLARWHGGLAWQVHFKQRADKPNLIKRYRIGVEGPSYPVALKGRAWISADNYQIVRLETDLVSPVPQIRLVADHSDIEYGPVKFKQANISMWLPRTADVYYDWKGRRIHRRHSFGNYLLFGVDDKQKITVPKVDDDPAVTGPSDAKPNQ